MQSKPVVIGVCGISGSGKSFLLSQLIKTMSEVITIVSTDNYYLPLDMQIKDENGVENFDIPSSIDGAKLIKDVQSLMKGQSVTIKKYTFNVPHAKTEYIVMKPKKILLVEGIFVLAIPDLRALFDHSFLIKSDLNKILENRILRDVSERGMQESLVRYQWENHVLPGYNTYVLPFENSVDTVVSNDHASTDFVIEVKRKIEAFL